MSSSDASASPPPSLQAECAVLRDASLSDGGETNDGLSLEALREQLRRMQLRLAESDAAASALGDELGACSDQYATTLAHLLSSDCICCTWAAFWSSDQPPRVRFPFRLRARRTLYRAPPARLRNSRTQRRVPGAVRRGAAAALGNRATWPR